MFIETVGIFSLLSFYTQGIHFFNQYVIISCICLICLINNFTENYKKNKIVVCKVIPIINSYYYIVKTIFLEAPCNLL